MTKAPRDAAAADTLPVARVRRRRSWLVYAVWLVPAATARRRWLRDRSQLVASVLLAFDGLLVASVLESEQWVLPLWFLAAMAVALGGPAPVRQRGRRATERGERTGSSCPSSGQCCETRQEACRKASGILWICPSGRGIAFAQPGPERRIAQTLALRLGRAGPVSFEGRRPGG